jgi:hypothetical protein
MIPTVVKLYIGFVQGIRIAYFYTMVGHFLFHFFLLAEGDTLAWFYSGLRRLRSLCM